MITIVHIITSLEIGGAERSLEKLVSSMDRSTFRNTVISLTELGSLAEDIVASGVCVSSLAMPRGVPDPRGLFRAVRLLRAAAPDIVQTWLYHADLLGYLAARLSGLPRLAWNVRCSDMDLRAYAPLSRAVRFALARLSGHPDVVVVNSEAGRRVHEQLGYAPRRWALIPNGFDVGLFKPNPHARAWLRAHLGIPQETKLIGLPARADQMKDHDTFFRAVALCARHCRDVHFLAVGRGVVALAAHQRERLAALELVSRVSFLDEGESMPGLLAGLDVVTLTSAFGEGFPNVLGEAMGCEIPCVSTDVGDAAMIVGDTGVIVPPRNAEALSNAWRKLLDAGSEERARLGHAARQRIVERFSLAAITRLYEDLYRDMMQRTLASGPSL